MELRPLGVMVAVLGAAVGSGCTGEVTALDGATAGDAGSDAAVDDAGVDGGPGGDAGWDGGSDAAPGDGGSDAAPEDGGSDAAPEDGGSDAAPDAAAPEGCGDGDLDEGEACDDGNLVEDDGCSPTCAIETGFGRGLDGALVVTEPTELPFVAVQILDASAGGTTATLGAMSEGGSFAVGRKVIVHQTREVTGAAGHFEYARIAELTETTVTFERPLMHDYATVGLTRAQMQLVPEYTSVTVSARLFAAGWNNLGQLGGMLVFDSQGAITITASGELHMSSRGFHGHAKSCPVFQCMQGTTGESYTGPGGARTTGNATGGGAGGVGDDGAGGGGGGNGTAGEAGSDGLCAGLAVCDAACPIPGGDGGAASPGDVATHLLFGGGGGMGGVDSEGARPGAGGYGGGIVAIRAASISVEGTIEANGANGGLGLGYDPACGGSGCGMGGGGGGAGGTIRIAVRGDASLGTGVQALGGARSVSTCGAAGGGGGGAGGAGRIGVEAASVTGTTSPPHTAL